MDKLVLSPLAHTWIFDIDGTLVKHNGYKLDGHDTLLPGVKQFFDENVKPTDMVILLTSREEQHIEYAKKVLTENGIRYDYIIGGAPYGERILINDRKPSGLETSKAINVDRDRFLIENIVIDDGL